MLNWVGLIPVLPLIGFLITAFAGKKIGRPRSGYLATFWVFASFLVSCGVLVALLGMEGEHRRALVSLCPFVKDVPWIVIGNFQVHYQALVDPLAMLMCLIVTGIGGLIHLYAVGYMAEDKDFPRFFTYLNLFIFFMLMLVLGGNILLMFVGWEGVGLCSYLLISFWFEDIENSKAGNKAFIVNRIGDVGFALGIMAIFHYFGTLTFYNPATLGGFLDMASASKIAGGVLTTGIATTIGLLLFVGAVGKSAQFPLYVWLPDAMAGPTPVSALIHAATMVTAGVVMVTRVSPIIVQSHTVMIVIAAIGTFTALFAATIALTQNDIKKVLAYSTVSQLGYMFLGCGVGAFSAGMFHVTTHAFFKALLFLGAGSVIHAMHHEQDMRKMGGLKKLIPVTYFTMMAGYLAIAGIFPFAGFWSKDEILGKAYGFQYFGIVFYVVGVLTAALTAFYMSRLMWKTFWSEKRFDEAALGHDHGHATHDDHMDHADAHGSSGDASGHAGERAEEELSHASSHQDAHGGVHESPPTMTLPLIILAVLSAVGGLIGTPWFNKFEQFLEPSVPPVGLFKPEEGVSPVLGMVIGTVAALVGIGIAYALYSKRRQTGEILTPEQKQAPTLLGEAYRGSVNLWGFDQLATWLGIDLGGSLARTSAWIDRNIIDGIVNGVAGVAGISSEVIRRAQTGFVRSYALVMLFGVCLVVASILWPIISHH